MNYILIIENNRGKTYFLAWYIYRFYQKSIRKRDSILQRGSAAKYIMSSLVSWLKGTGPKPGSKRGKRDDENDDDSRAGPSQKIKKFTKELNHDRFSW